MRKILALVFASLLASAACFAQASGPTPPPLLVAPAAHVTLTVTATGSAPMSYQWQKQAADGSFASIAGATATPYVIAAAAVSDAGVYRCVVSNNFGTVVSNNAALSVGNPPTVTGLTSTSP